MHGRMYVCIGACTGIYARNITYARAYVRVYVRVRARAGTHTGRFSLNLLKAGWEIAQFQ